MIVAVVIFCLPFAPASVPWNDEFDAPAFNYTPLVLVVGAARRDLVGRCPRRTGTPGPVRTLEEDEVTRETDRLHGDAEAASRPGPAARAGPPACCRSTTCARRPRTATIDTVVTAFTDMQGRLFGKRIQAEYFLDDVVEHGVEGCNYLLALDMEMDPIPGYEMANWEGGYGDFAIVPDMATLRRIPWLDRTALVLCDVANHDGSPVVASPRQVLIAQYERAHAMGYTPMFASELEFYLYKESYAEAHEKDYRGLTPTIPYILDYHILATTMDEPYLGPIRRGMHARRDPGRVLEGRGLVRAARGQHPLRRCGHLRRPPHDLQERRQGDRVPERHLGDVHGEALREGHRQLLPHPLQPRRRDGGKSVFVDGDEETDVFRHYLGGHARAHQGAGAVRRAVDQLLQALRDRELGADLDLLGPRQPHLRLPHRRPRRSRGGSSAGSPAPTSTPTSATRRCWPPASTASSRAPTRARS